MRQCRACRGTDIVSRTNYSHGRKSTPTTTYRCRGCGSTDIETRRENRRHGGFRVRKKGSV